MEWRGVSFFALAQLARPEPEAKHLLFKGCGGYWTNNPIEACLEEEVRIAHSTSWEVLGFGELKSYSNTANPWTEGPVCGIELVVSSVFPSSFSPFGLALENRLFLCGLGEDRVSPMKISKLLWQYSMAGWGLLLLLSGQCFIALGEDSRDFPDWKAEDWKPLFSWFAGFA